MPVIVVEEVSIFQLSMKYRWMASVYEDAGDYGICSKYLSTLGKVPTYYFCL